MPKLSKIPPFKLHPKIKNWIFVPKPEHYAAQRWCFDSGIKISVDLIDNGFGDYNKCRIKITQGKKVSYGKKIYPNDSKVYSEVIWELYLEIFNKQNINK
jgi:hypothetical protein